MSAWPKFEAKVDLILPRLEGGQRPLPSAQRRSTSDLRARPRSPPGPRREREVDPSGIPASTNPPKSGTGRAKKGPHDPNERGGNVPDCFAPARRHPPDGQERQRTRGGRRRIRDEQDPGRFVRPIMKQRAQCGPRAAVEFGVVRASWGGRPPSQAMAQPITARSKARGGTAVEGSPILEGLPVKGHLGPFASESLDEMADARERPW